MSSLALTSGWYYICTLYCTPDSDIGIKDNRLSFILFSLIFIVDYKVKKTKCDIITGHMTRSHKSHTYVT